ncbi:TonB-dependent receptor domain-containing protein [Candidatus Reidiella endopervernicosa]|nr:TonB-dependent receptor [Candidatus Reidiella endopervernicosa]
MNLNYSMTPRLVFDIGVVALDAHYDAFSTVDPNNPLDDPDRSGDPLPDSPNLALNLGLSYHWLHDQGVKTGVSANYRYRSRVYFSPYHDEAVMQEGHGVLDIGMDIRGQKERWSLSLFVNNLTDELYARSIVRVDPIVGTTRFWGEPRHFGASLEYRF